MLKKLKRAIRSFEQKFEKRGYRSPLKKHRSLSQKVSLIVPTYNVEPYINEFLASVTSQTTGLRNLEVIIVDDGSTDRTGEIAQAWARRYPKTIRYIRQENSGAAEARNTGLDHATGDWVSFPDPDDMLPPKWLAAFNRELRRKHVKPLLLVSMPIHVFQEKTGRVRNNHPLSVLYRKRTEAQTEDLGDYILLSTAKTFFQRREIERHGLRFDSKVRPSFEDAHFVNRLLAFSPGYSTVRLRRPAYIYRKREAGTSQLDRTKTNPHWLTSQIRFGYIDLIRQTKDEDGAVPRFVQRAILYSLGWRFRYLVNHSERLAFLTDEQRTEFRSLLFDVFDYIDAETIRTMNLGGLHEELKIGILGIFKGDAPGNDFVYLAQHDAVTQEVQLIYSTGGCSDPDVKILVDGAAATPMHPSHSVSTFLDAPFYTVHRFWVRAPAGSTISATIDGRCALLRARGRGIGDKVSAEGVAAALRPSPPNERRLGKEARILRAYATSQSSRLRFAGCWVLMDRDDTADDNAEHLYRFMIQNGSTENAYFILRRDSEHWEKLEKEGFKLLAFGSADHVAALVNATILASSHPDRFVLWPVRESWIRDLVNHKFVFLQHGITKDDLSDWLNSKPIRMIVTASAEEWHSIASPRSKYVFSERETKLTGFPRHDALLERPHSTNTILIMPTWRRLLVADGDVLGSSRKVVPNFMETRYTQDWRALLASDRLRSLALEHGKEIVFCPHPNMAMYLDEFDLPDYIRCRDPRQPPSIQETFAEAAMMITDYSSVAFECAYIERPIAYYQFDRDEFFAREHVYTKGYFDYQHDGFGPVAETHDQVLDAIERALSGNEDPIYAQRRESFFTFRDGRCCERVYNAIRELLPEEVVVEKTKPLAAE